MSSKTDNVEDSLADLNIGDAKKDANEKSELEILDPRGDVIIENGPHRLLMSSNILMLTSTYFSNMLKPDAFLEGEEAPSRTNPPTKVLADDQPDSFRTVMKLLHFQTVTQPTSTSALADIATICDYYGIESAISYRIDIWVGIFSPIDVNNLKDLLWVSYVFKLSRRFSNISARLAVRTTRDEVEMLDLSPMPSVIEVNLEVLQAKYFRQLSNLIEQSLVTVKHHKPGFENKTFKTCTFCHREKPYDTSTCGHCRNSAFIMEPCRQATRLLWFVQWLEAVGCWPASERASKSCEGVAKLLGNPTTLKASTGSPHSCVGTTCPYETVRSTLIRSTKKLCDDAAGLKLEDYSSTAQ